MSNGAVERSGKSGRAHDLAEGAGQTAPLRRKRNFERRPHLRVLVCGGRDFADESAVVNALFRIDDERPIGSIIHGGAHGADTLGGVTAKLLHVPCQVFPANWKRDGKAAGPIRNQRMLEEGKPNLVVAFPGGRGTADMVARARMAGVEVIEVSV